jgi:lysozyme
MGQFIDAGLNLLKQLEGCRLNAYQDQAGIWTIGYGHTGPEVRGGLGWPQAQADSTLMADVTRFATGVARYVPTSLNDNQFSALVIFAYNIGLVGFAASTADKLVNAGDLASVPDSMLRWDKIHQNGVLVVNPGLHKRRLAEINLWYTAPGLA